VGQGRGGCHVVRGVTRRSVAEYEILDAGDGSFQVICFAGHMQGQAIMWQARVCALGEGRRSYIDVQNIDNGTGAIEIGLPVEVVDTPTLNKTIVMIRQYKNLRPGRHEFGPHKQ